MISSDAAFLTFVSLTCVRTISNVGYREHTTPLFVKLNLLKLPDLYYLILGKFMFKYMNNAFKYMNNAFKYMNNALPQCFSTYFMLMSSVHSHNTRNTVKTKHLLVGLNRTSLYKNGLVQRCVAYWTALNNPIKKSRNLPIFTVRNRKKHIGPTQCILIMLLKLKLLSTFPCIFGCQSLWSVVLSLVCQ